MRVSNALRKRILIRDICITILSVAIAILMVKIGILEHILSFTQGNAILGSFLAGIFFTSIFTIAPASVVLAEITLHTPILTVALFGALGAVIGDLVIFLFIRDSVTGDVDFVLKKMKFKKILSYFHLGFLRLFSPVIGALIIASPLPDELGLAIMGFANMPAYAVIPISFSMNFIGILGIAVIAKIL